MEQERSGEARSELGQAELRSAQRERSVGSKDTVDARASGSQRSDPGVQRGRQGPNR